MDQKKRVGLIGVGLMGHGIGKNILKHGYALTVLANRNRQPVESLLEKGATEAASAAELARESDVVILVVTGSPQVEDVMYREGGLLEGMHDGLIIADCSTAEPDSTIQVAARVHAAGGRFVDIPMVRTPKEAEEGKLALMTGGDQQVLAEIQPIMDCFADTFVYAGDVGAAHKLKLVNNFIALGTAAVVAEGIAVAQKGGIDMVAMRDLVSAGGGNSVMFERFMTTVLEDDDSVFKFAISNAQKDLRYYTTMTGQQPMASFIAQSVYQTYIMAGNQGYSEKFVPRLPELLRKINGMD